MEVKLKSPVLFVSADQITAWTVCMLYWWTLDCYGRLC